MLFQQNIFFNHSNYIGKQICQTYFPQKMGSLRDIYVWNVYVTFFLGAPLNLLLFWLILRHTPKGMRPFSMVLLQNAITDISGLIIQVIAQPVKFFHKFR